MMPRICCLGMPASPEDYWSGDYLAIVGTAPELGGEGIAAMTESPRSAQDLPAIIDGN